jgi:hypothetical protein
LGGAIAIGVLYTRGDRQREDRPPIAITMLGRWHEIDGTGFAISESNDPKVMFSGYWPAMGRRNASDELFRNEAGRET